MNLTNQINKFSLTTIDDRLFNLMKEELNTEEQQQFVNSFKLYLKYGYDETAFVIDFDIVWKWIGFTRKDNAKTLLIKKFIENKDFMLSNSAPAITGALSNSNINSTANNKEIILLTVSAFKKFCMKASTKRADEICEYYIKMEKIMFQYTEEKLNDYKYKFISLQQENNEVKNKLKNFIEYDEELFWNENQINDYNNKNVLYIAFIGIFNNERIYKFGKSEQIYTREFKQHQKFFDIFKMRFVVECDNMSYVEKEFKKFLKSINLLKNIEIKDSNLTELFTIKEKHNIEYVIENLIKLVEDNPLPAVKNLIEIIKQKDEEIENLKKQAIENLKKQALLSSDISKDNTIIDNYGYSNEKQLNFCIIVEKERKNINKYKEIKEIIKKNEESKNIEVQNEIIDNKQISKQNKCVDCGKSIRKQSQRCLECYNKEKLLVKQRPSYEQLKKDVKELNFTGTGKKYNVSDNAIRKWIKRYEKEKSEEDKILKNRKKTKPSYIELMETIKNTNMKETAIKYEVDISTIRDWIRIYEEDMPEENKIIVTKPKPTYEELMYTIKHSRSIKEVAIKYDVFVTTIYNWKRKYEEENT